jgi:hypothetical protein
MSNCQRSANEPRTSQPKKLAVGWLESLADRAARFSSGPWGTHVGFGLLAFWLGASVAVGWNQAYSIVDEIVTMSSFLL